MKVFDAFNGDADGICALIQLRLARPQPEATLVTGVKRDIALLERIDGQSGDEITALDISLDKNRPALVRLLNAGARVMYFDHHFAGEIPDHPALTTRINTQPEVCTSLLVNRETNGAFGSWAITGAFGDNLDRPANALAQKQGLGQSDVLRLQALGVCMNYNAYGASENDLHFPPSDLYRRLYRYSDPLQFLDDDSATFSKLQTGYQQDLERARNADVLHNQPHAAVMRLPNEPWSRRVSGVFGNELANQFPDRAHAVVTQGTQGLLVSVRAPLNNKQGADEICRQFETGGGRKAAAGINRLPPEDLDRFITTFASHYQP
ncbi:MAG: hypothetical protein AB8B96_20225 [Lysobacterales bacterium]